MTVLDFLKKYKKILMIAVDVAVIPGLFLLKYLSSFMLTTNRPCPWTLLGLQCATCGGTRCINNLLSGNIVEAIKLNPFIFLCIMYLVISFIFLNILILKNSFFTKKALKKMYSLWSLVIVLVAVAMFFLGRNIYNVIILFSSL